MNIENNVFHFTRELILSNSSGDGGATPDLVLFVNGIPFGVIECKSPLLEENQAISQHIRNQKAEYIPQLYKFSQVLLASNKNSIRFGTTGTPKKFWNIWKEQYTDWQRETLDICVVDRLPTEQDKALVSLFAPQRLFNRF